MWWGSCKRSSPGNTDGPAHAGPPFRHRSALLAVLVLLLAVLILLLAIAVLVLLLLAVLVLLLAITVLVLLSLLPVLVLLVLVALLVLLVLVVLVRHGGDSLGRARTDVLVGRGCAWLR